MRREELPVNHDIDTPGTRYRSLTVIVALFGLALMLRTSDLQSEFIAAAKVAAAPAPARAAICPITDVIAPEVAALTHDIGRRFHVTQGAAHSIAAAALSAAHLRGIDPALLLAVAAVESKFRPGAVNPATGATGLMQVVPKWHQDKIQRNGGESSLMLIAPNINVGAAILAEYVAAEDGNIVDALGHYLGTAGADRYINHVRLEMAHFGRVLGKI